MATESSFEQRRPSFGTDMLDQQDLLEKYGYEGTESVVHLTEYLRRRAALATEYGRGLQKLNRSFASSQPDPKFEILMAASEKTAQCNLDLAQRIDTDIVERLKLVSRNHDKQRREAVAEIKDLRQEWKKCQTAFQKARKLRDAAIKSTEEARLLCERLSNDKHATRSQCEKAHEEYMARCRRLLLAKEEFSQTLKMTQERQIDVYRKELPALFDKLYSFEQTRLSCCKTDLLDLAQTAADLLKSDEEAARQTTARLGSWDPHAELVQFVEKSRKSVPFEIPDPICDDGIDYCIASVSNASLPTFMSGGASSVGGSLHEALKITAANAAQPSSSSSLTSSLSNLSLDALQVKARDLDKDIPLLERKVEGLNSLRSVYDAQPALADEKTRTEMVLQLNELSDLLQKKVSERDMITSKIAVNASSPSAPSAPDSNSSAFPSANKKSQSAATLSARPPLHNQGERGSDARAAPSTMASSVSWDDIPASMSAAGTAASKPPLVSINDNEDEDGLLFSRIHPHSVLGKEEEGKRPDGGSSFVNASAADRASAGTISIGLYQVKALYDFEAAPETLEMSMCEGDMFMVLSDDGEWWEAVNSATGQHGYIPFNYVQPMLLADFNSAGTCTPSHPAKTAVSTAPQASV